jgi:hypothetical protein
MNKAITIISILIISVSKIGFSQGRTEPWSPAQLIQPESLASTLNDSNLAQPLVISIGPAGLIKGAIRIGPMNEKENIKELKQLLSKQDKKKEVIIYCGCCPFKSCPNIRPAFSLLNEMKFSNHKLLNLPRNLKVDWIDHGYPMNSRAN